MTFSFVPPAGEPLMASAGGTSPGDELDELEPSRRRRLLDGRDLTDMADEAEEP